MKSLFTLLKRYGSLHNTIILRKVTVRFLEDNRKQILWVHPNLSHSFCKMHQWHNEQGLHLLPLPCTLPTTTLALKAAAGTAVAASVWTLQGWGKILASLLSQLAGPICPSSTEGHGRSPETAISLLY